MDSQRRWRAVLSKDRMSLANQLTLLRLVAVYR